MTKTDRILETLLDLDGDGFSPPTTPCVFFRVKDSGHGVPESSIRKMSDPFFTTRNFGRGMGLAQTLATATQHRGWIHVDSSDGAQNKIRQGTVMTVWFPSLPDESASHP